MKRIPKLFAVAFALLACVSATTVSAEELKPSVENVTVYRIENFANGKFLSNGDNVNNDARIILHRAMLQVQVKNGQCIRQVPMAFSPL